MMKFWRKLFTQKNTKEIKDNIASQCPTPKLTVSDREKSFADFANKACESRQTIRIKLKEAYPLVLALEKAVIAEKGIESREAFRRTSDNIILACPRCGEYNDEARDIALLAGEGGAFEQMAGVKFGGPTVASLGQGRCPGCSGKEVDATFDPQIAGV